MKVPPTLPRLMGLVILGSHFAAPWTAQTAGGSDRGQKYALLVGINDYAPPFQDLDFCHSDMEELREVLITAGFPQENVVYMHDGAAEPALYPSKVNLIRQLELRLGLANEDDLIVVAFSGHGLLEDQVSYLCPSDTVFDDLAETCISMEQIYERMRPCRASQKLMLIDACRNERPFRGIKSGSGIEGFAAELQEPPKGLRVLSSCEAGQWSAEDPKLKHGVFMYFVTQGLRGKADQECEGNRNGRVSLDELYAYAHQRTKTYVANSHGILQRPWMKGESVGVLEIGTFIGGATERRASDDPQATTSEANKATAGSRTASSDYASISKQAATHLKQGDYNNAIIAYSAIVDDTNLPIEWRKQARRSRGAAYLGRCKGADIDKAIIDQKAAGLAGIQMSIRTASSELKVGETVKGKVGKGQVVLVTASKEDWLWVDSVSGDATLRGWLKKNVVLDKDTVASKPKSSNYRSPVQVTSASWNQYQSSTNQYQSSGSGYPFIDKYIRKHGRPPSALETPRWESLREIRELRSQGLLR